LRQRFNHKQVQRTDVNAVATGCAGIHMHGGKPFPIHGDCIEGAYLFTVSQSKAAPSTCTASAIDHHRRSTRRDSLIPGQIFHESFTASTFETSDSFLLGTNIDTEQFGNLDETFLATDRALAGTGFRLHQLSRKRRTAWFTTGPAVISRQQILDLFQARVFLYV
jgi:hypothetical protein